MVSDLGFDIVCVQELETHPLRKTSSRERQRKKQNNLVLIFHKQEQGETCTPKAWQNHKHATPVLIKQLLMVAHEPDYQCGNQLEAN